MPTTMQNFLADATQKASQNLVTIFLRLPEDKRDWSPAETARTAVDQIAECAVLCGYTAETIENRKMTEGSMESFFADKAKAQEQAWETLHTQLQENTARVSAAIRAVSDEDLEIEIPLPWGPMTLAQMITYPSWNMHYHEGQINYIAAILGCQG